MEASRQAACGEEGGGCNSALPPPSCDRDHDAGKKAKKRCASPASAAASQALNRVQSRPRLAAPPRAELPTHLFTRPRLNPCAHTPAACTACRTRDSSPSSSSSSSSSSESDEERRRKKQKREKKTKRDKRSKKEKRSKKKDKKAKKEKRSKRDKKDEDEERPVQLSKFVKGAYDSSSDEEGVQRSSISGLKIKMKIDKTKEDKKLVSVDLHPLFARAQRALCTCRRS